MSGAALMNVAWTTQLLKIALIVTALLPFVYLVYRVRRRNLTDTAIYAGFVMLYLLLHAHFLLGKYFTYHDTRANLHLAYSLLNQYISLGDPGGWNPFMNGGEPFYLYSNFFLSSETVGFILLNKLFCLPINDLINIYFVFLVLSFATFGFVFFSILFKDRAATFFCTAVLMFGGITAGAAGQTNLLPQYFVPLAGLSAYLFLSRRDWLWLAWAVFFLAVAGNRYFPHYLAFFLGALICSWFIVKPLARKEPEWAHVKMRRAPYVMAAVLLSVVALLPATYVFRYFSANCISPTRGNAALSEQRNGSQGCVSISLPQYQYLLYMPRGQQMADIQEAETDAPAYAKDLEYVHSPAYVGIIAVLLALWAVVKCRQRVLLAFVATLVFLILMGAGEQSLLWLFFKKYVPFFYIRHSVHFHTIITFAIIVLAGFGFTLLKPSNGLRWTLISLVIVMGMFMSWWGRTYIQEPPAIPAPFEYPTSRSYYLEGRVTQNIPMDFNPILVKKAAAAHTEDNFIFMRSKDYHALLQEFPVLAEGPLFTFSDRLLNLEDMAEHVKVMPCLSNPSFETWRKLPSGLLVPTGWAVEADADSPRVGLRPADGPGQTKDGKTSVLLSNLPGPAEIRLAAFVAGKWVAGKHVAFSVWVKSENQRPRCVQIDAADGVGPRRLAVYSNGGNWERLHVVLTVSPECQHLKLCCRVLDNADAPAYFDGAQLAEEDADFLSPLPFRYLESSNPDRLTVEVDAPREGYVMRRENFHPDWSATLDGKPAAIEKFAGTFQAVRVTAGRHLLDFRFRSPYATLFWMHVAAALLGQVLFFVCLVRWNDAEDKLTGHLT